MDMDSNPYALAYPAASPLTFSLLSEHEEGKSTLSKREQANVCERLADSFYNDGDRGGAVEYLLMACETFEFYRDWKACGRLRNKLGCTYFEMREYAKSGMAFEGQKDDGAKNGKSVVIASSLCSTSILKCVTGDYEGACATIDEAVAVLEAGDKEEIGRAGVVTFCWHVKGVVAAAGGQWKDAIQLHGKDLKGGEAASDVNAVYRARVNLGVCHLKNGDVGEGLALFSICKDIGNGDLTSLEQAQAQEAADATVEAPAPDDQSVASMESAESLESLATIAPVAISAYDIARNNYHLGLCALLQEDYAAAKASVLTTIASCDESVAALKEERDANAATAQRLEAEADALDDGTGTKVAADPTPSPDDDSAPPSSDPPAFDSTQGGLLQLHAHNLLSLIALYTRSHDLPAPDLATAQSHSEKAVGLAQLKDYGVSKAIVANASGVISAAVGDVEKMKKAHQRNVKLLENERTFLLQEMKVEVGEENAVGHFGALIDYALFTGHSTNKKALKIHATHNAALSMRNGVSMGLSMDSGIAVIPAPTLRTVVDMHKKEYEAADRLDEKAAPWAKKSSAMAHGALGGTASLLGGRKSDAFVNLEINLKFAKEAGDKPMMASVLRTLAELQETGLEWKNSASTLKSYLDVAEEVGDLLLKLDALKKLVAMYVMISSTQKEMDAEALMEKEEYGTKTDAELDEMENDDQFLRANSKLRAARFAEKMKNLGNYWTWAHVSKQEDEVAKEEQHMKELGAGPNMPAFGGITLTGDMKKKNPFAGSAFG